MHFRVVVISVILGLALAGSSACSSSNDQVAVLETNYGRIVYEFLPDIAPKHTEAFQKMIASGFFDGTRFHRIIPGKIIQGGDPNSRDDDPSDDGMGQPSQATIPAEFQTTVKHTRGIVSAARKGDNKDSATSQFFICLDNEPNYDGSYSVFGRVIDGMNVVELIANAPTRKDDPKLRERPQDPVTITRAYLSTRAALGLPPKTDK
ncbi:MAG TPA: peptidylprolyl isomerase [Blastocatellia bacterium]|nr:peptidylprolyl isomerase [Blastocatellia bacterium]